MLSALSGCKMLRELSKLEVETETKLSMKELAQKFENLAHGETPNTNPPLILKLTITDVMMSHIIVTSQKLCYMGLCNK